MDGKCKDSLLKNNLNSAAVNEPFLEQLKSYQENERRRYCKNVYMTVWFRTNYEIGCIVSWWCKKMDINQIEYKSSLMIVYYVSTGLSKGIMYTFVIY